MKRTDNAVFPAVIQADPPKGGEGRGQGPVFTSPAAQSGMERM
jgi:hypothetical protein